MWREPWRGVRPMTLCYRSRSPTKPTYGYGYGARLRPGPKTRRPGAADLENVRLSLHAELALDYFQLESLDAEEDLLNSTVNSYEQALQLTQDRFRGGLASQVDVEQAQTQLETTRAQAIDVQAARAQFEHAVATLIGKPPAQFTLSPSPL